MGMIGALYLFVSWQEELEGFCGVAWESLTILWSSGTVGLWVLAKKHRWCVWRPPPLEWNTTFMIQKSWNSNYISEKCILSKIESCPFVVMLLCKKSDCTSNRWLLLWNNGGRKRTASITLGGKSMSVEEVQHFPCCQPFRRPRAIMRSLLPSCQHGSSALVFSPAQLFKTNRYDLSYCLPKEDFFHLGPCGTNCCQSQSS